MSSKHIQANIGNVADSSSADLRDQVIRLLARCSQWRSQNDQRAIALAKAASNPSDVIVYWILKHLEEPCQDAVAVPCKRVQLNVDSLKTAPNRIRFAVVAAALQAVHSRNFAPHAKVRELAISAAYCGVGVPGSVAWQLAVP